VYETVPALQLQLGFDHGGKTLLRLSRLNDSASQLQSAVYRDYPNDDFEEVSAALFTTGGDGGCDEWRHSSLRPTTNLN
jgi:hypothetical protein